jgi:hypothetical protein
MRTPRPFDHAQDGPFRCAVGSPFVRRKTFNLATAISLVLCIPITTIWITSQLRTDHFLRLSWSEKDRRYTSLGLYWDGGRLGGSYRWEYLQPSDKSWKPGEKPFWMHHSEEAGDLGWRWWFYFHSDDVDRETGFVGMRLWPIVLLTALFPALKMMRIMRGSVRLREGLCPTCGYDLRATPERCPECGTKKTNEQIPMTNQ